jgi:ATP-dependent Clp protease ATP-binding subunit ClpX
MIKYNLVKKFKREYFPIIRTIHTNIEHLLTNFTPLDIYRALDEYVIGQHDVKIALAVGVHSHFIRSTLHPSINHNANSIKNSNPYSLKSQSKVDNTVEERMKSLHIEPAGALTSLHMLNKVPEANTENPPDNQAEMANYVNSDSVTLEKTNILVMGPTGSGKTLMAKVLSRYINVPLVIADATAITETGYVGLNVESVLANLYSESGRNIDLTQRGIIYLDEIDKVIVYCVYIEYM